MSISSFLQRFFADERGATAVEYGLIVTLIVLAMVGSLTAFANAATDMWNDVNHKVGEAIEKD